MSKVNFFDKYSKSKIGGLPRYIQLREAILAAIEDGYWKPDSKLPPEAEIAKTTPFSLGTVQRAFRSLVDDGLVVRRQGRGTFVAKKQITMDVPWHCRFTENDEKQFLPVFPRVVLREQVDGDAPWAQILNPKGKTFIRIDRVIQIGQKFAVYSKFFLDGVKFLKFLDKTDQDLERTNFKTLLRREYNIPITHMSYTLRFIRLPADICNSLRLPETTVGLVYCIVASSGMKRPVYYQEIYIPPNDCKLHISDSSNIPEYWT